MLLILVLRISICCGQDASQSCILQYTNYLQPWFERALMVLFIEEGKQEVAIKKG